jgi:2-polyprenyl-3-methyl-5-hydroxy-6-metoxy-1,4-benzoquinol methylase
MPSSVNDCPVCQSQKSTFFKEYNACSLYRCEKCHTTFVSPYISSEQVTDLYNSSIDRASSELITRLDKKMRRARRRAKHLKNYTGGNRFLDVGSNVGFMVEAARENGFTAEGVEVDPNYVATAKKNFPKNTFSQGMIEDYTSSGGPFDLVYCSEVIEHVPNSRPFAEALAGQVRPGGYLYITTPDISHWRIPGDIAKWDAFCPPSHCVFFTPDSLKNLFLENGLVLKKKYIAFKPGIKMIFQKPLN